MWAIITTLTIAIAAAWLFLACVLLAKFESYLLSMTLSRAEHRLWFILLLPVIIIIKIYDYYHVMISHIRHWFNNQRRFFN